MAKDDIIDVEVEEKKTTEEVKDDVEEKAEEVKDDVEDKAEEVKEEAEEKVEEEKSKIKDDFKEGKEKIREGKDKAREEWRQGSDKAREEFRESRDRVREEWRQGTDRAREEFRENREKMGETYDWGRDVAGKVGENLGKTIDDAIDALKSFQKDVDSRYQDYKVSATSNRINVDLVDAKGFYYLQAYLPGVSKEDIEIEASKNEITIKAKFNDIFDKINSPEESKPKSVLSGIKEGSSERTIKLDEEIVIDEVTAKHDNGVLFLTIPKVDAPKTKVNID